jgi:hypothetical protein
MVVGSSRGLECIGHRGGGPYVSIEEYERRAEEAVRKGEIARIEREKEVREAVAAREAARWFRPLIPAAEALPPSPWWQSLPSPILRMLFSSIEEVLIQASTLDLTPHNRKLLETVGLEAVAEVLRRKLPWPECPYDLDLAQIEGKDCHEIWRMDAQPFTDEELQVDWHALDTRTLKLLEGCAHWVADYSQLEAGTRQVIMYLCGHLQFALTWRKASIYNSLEEDLPEE